MSTPSKSSEPVTFGAYGQLCSKASDAELEELIAEAPIPKTEGDLPSVATNVAGTLLPFFRWADVDKVASLMMTRWIPRCPKYESRSSVEETIDKAATAARQDRDNEQMTRLAEDEYRDVRRASDKSMAEHLARTVAAQKAKEEASKKRLVKLIRKRLKKCSLGHAYFLLTGDSTGNPRIADMLAEITGKERKFFLSPLRRRGRRTRIANLLNKIYIEGGTFLDYVRSDPEIDDDGEAGQLFTAMRDGYESRTLIEDHFPTFDEFRKAARRVEFGPDTAEVLWYDYLLWRKKILLDYYSAEIEDERWG
jgi:hypothetical protein